MPRARKPRAPGAGGLSPAAPGVSYPNRSDMNTQPVRVPTGQAYGARKAAVASQQAAPLPATPPIPLDAPTQNPGEHVMTGAPAGPGPGPQDIGLGQGDEVVDLLSAAYRAYPTEELRGMLEEAQTRWNDA